MSPGIVLHIFFKTYSGTSTVETQTFLWFMVSIFLFLMQYFTISTQARQRSPSITFAFKNSPVPELYVSSHTIIILNSVSDREL